jgi:short-subunit dehydrogenase
VSDYSFHDRIAVVTGGSAGIGKQIARDLAARGSRVVISSNVPERLSQAARELAELGLTVDAFPCDVRSGEQVAALARHVLDRYGRLDVLVNNAGFAVYRAFEESSTEEVLDIVDVNLLGSMRCAKAFLPSMIARRAGRIVNISSIGGATVLTPNASYCAAKSGMIAWSRAIRYELSRFGISVHVICPDHVKTSFQEHPTFRRRDRYRKKRGGALTVEAVSRSTLDAIVRDRPLTYVPRRNALVVWGIHAAPFLTLPVWGRLMRKRIAQLYQEIERERADSRAAGASG